MTKEKQLTTEEILIKIEEFRFQRDAINLALCELLTELSDRASQIEIVKAQLTREGIKPAPHDLM